MMRRCPNCKQPTFSARQVLIEAPLRGSIVCSNCGRASHHQMSFRQGLIVMSPFIFFATPLMLTSRPEFWALDAVGLFACAVMSLALGYLQPLRLLEKPGIPERSAHP
jgi:hypothetical protein